MITTLVPLLFLPWLAAGATPTPAPTMNLEVLVVDETGRPWEGAMVQAGAIMRWRLRYGGCSRDTSQRSLITDENGRVRLELPLEDAKWVRVAAYVVHEKGMNWRLGPGPQQWIEATPRPRTVEIVMPRDTPLQSRATTTAGVPSRDQLRVRRADGQWEDRPIGGGGPGFRTPEPPGSFPPQPSTSAGAELVLRPPPELVALGPAWLSLRFPGSAQRIVERLAQVPSEIRRESQRSGAVEVDLWAETGEGASANAELKTGAPFVVDLTATRRRISGTVLEHGGPLSGGSVKVDSQVAPVGADGRFVLESVPNGPVELCVDTGRFGWAAHPCRPIPARGNLEVEFDATPVRITGQIVGSGWSDVWTIDLRVSLSPGIFIGPEGRFETPELPAGCYGLLGVRHSSPNAVGGIVRLEPGEHAEFVLDADNPSHLESYHLLGIRDQGCRPVEARVKQLGS